MIDRLQVHVVVGGSTVPAGTAHFQLRRQRLTTSFIYEVDYLAMRGAYALDPRLPLANGAHHVEGLPGAFADCAPDRWGRNLITRRFRAEARDAGGRARGLSEVDFLVGVADLSRQGALRFARSSTGPFEHPDPIVPPLVELPRLLNASNRVADEDDLGAVKELLDAGSASLGGARPKASVSGDDGRLLIAKFPHPSDSWSVMAWEKTALDLAARAGITTPSTRLVDVGRQRVLLLSRFDRSDAGGRIGYLSAMSLIDGRDGGSYDYEDIVDVLPEFGARVTSDLTELFRRAAFNVAVHNTDDHLRNHGFLHRSGGWALSPVFDVNPNPDLGVARQTAIAAASESSDEVEGLVSLGEACRLTRNEAIDVIGEIVVAVTSWRNAAERNGVHAREIRDFADMFEDRLAALGAVA